MKTVTQTPHPDPLPGVPRRGSKPGKRKRRGGAWSIEKQRRYEAALRSGLVDVPQIPDELDAVLRSGREPSDELAARASAEIAEACRALREKHTPPRRPAPLDAEDDES